MTENKLIRTIALTAGTALLALTLSSAFSPDADARGGRGGNAAGGRADRTFVFRTTASGLTVSKVVKAKNLAAAIAAGWKEQVNIPARAGRRGGVVRGGGGGQRPVVNGRSGGGGGKGGRKAR